jgi:hypothetical protein
MLYMCAKLIREWAMLCKQEDGEKLETWAVKLERRSARPPHLTWVQASGSSTSENRVHSPSDRAGGGDERGAESCSLSLRLPLISEQTKLVCASAPVVSATTVSFASESKGSWGRGS